MTRALKKAVVAVAGVRVVTRAKAIKLRMLPPRPPRPERPWAEPSGPGQYGKVSTPEGTVRVCLPRAETEPGSGKYPPVVPGPPVPRIKAPLPRAALEYYPGHHVKEHPRKWDFPAYLDNASCRWLQTLKGMYASPFSFPSSLSPEAGLLLHSLVRNVRPRVVVETGSFIGVSTIWIASALAENGDGGVVHAFDDFGPIHKGPWRDVEMPKGRLEFVAGNLARAGLGDRVVMHPGNSAFEIRAFHKELREAGGVQLAFLDADHGIVGVWQDFWATESVLNTGGFVVLHDTFPELCSYDGPRHLIDNLEKQAAGVYQKMDFYLAPMNYGLGLIRRIG